MSTVQDPFTVTATSGEGGEFERPEPGTYPARLAAVVDLGTHTRTFQGQSKKQRRLFLVWELTGENDSKGEAFVVGQDYTFSLNAKAKFRALVEAWTGKTMADGQPFNVTEMIDKPCCVSISEGQSSTGKKFSEIASVGPVMKGLTVPELTRTPFVYTVSGENSSANDPAIPDWLPRIYGRTVVDEIKASDEWAGLPDF